MFFFFALLFMWGEGGKRVEGEEEGQKEDGNFCRLELDRAREEGPIEARSSVRRPMASLRIEAPHK